MIPLRALSLGSFTWLLCACGSAPPPEPASPPAPLDARAPEPAPVASTPAPASPAPVAPAPAPASPASTTALASSREPAPDAPPKATAPVTNAPAAEAGLDVPDANITVGSITADGFTMKDLACRSDGGGLGALMLGPAVAGSLAHKRAALRACAPKGGEPRVRFTIAGGKVTAAEAKADSPAVEACLVKALKSAPAVMDATCAVTLVLK